MIYENTNEIKTTKEEIERLNKYFEIEFDLIDNNGDYEQQDLIDELCAREDDSIGLFVFEFENGYKISFDLHSGSSNYYDNVCLYNNDDEYWFDCDYCIEETMKFEADEDTYICKLTII